MIKFIVKRQCWSLTIYGKISLLLFMGVISWSSIDLVYPFLAETNRVHAKILVIEGWLQPVLLKQVAAEFVNGKYDIALLVQPVLGLEDQQEIGRLCGEYKSFWLIKHGIDKNQLNVLFVNVAMKDRTYNAAIIAKKWLSENHLLNKPINVVTMGTHARRSNFLYKKAFGEQSKIGIIPIQNIEYDPAQWWRTSAGFREVLGELIAYAYARFFFYPTK